MTHHEDDPALWTEAWKTWEGFNPDGCTASPDFTFKDCCIQHDYYYKYHTHRTSGEPISRAEADKKLRECIANRKVLKTKWHYKLLPWVYWLGVRVGGRRAWKSKD